MKNDPKVIQGVSAMEASVQRMRDACALRTTRVEEAEAEPVLQRPARPTPSAAVRMVAQLATVLLALGVAASLLGATCTDLPPVSNCTPMAQRCHQNRPEVCSATRRWHAAGDQPCDAVQGVCALDDAGTAHCQRVTP